MLLAFVEMLKTALSPPVPSPLPSSEPPALLEMPRHQGDLAALQERLLPAQQQGHRMVRRVVAYREGDRLDLEHFDGLPAHTLLHLDVGAEEVVRWVAGGRRIHRGVEVDLEAGQHRLANFLAFLVGLLREQHALTGDLRGGLRGATTTTTTTTAATTAATATATTTAATATTAAVATATATATVAAAVAAATAAATAGERDVKGVREAPRPVRCWRSPAYSRCPGCSD